MNFEDIPKDLSEFLTLYQQLTEKDWADYCAVIWEIYKSEGNKDRPDWLHEIKWSHRLSDQEIDTIEEKWQLKFPADYRMFLQLLGAPNRPPFPEAYHKTGAIPAYYLFYNWLIDDEYIKQALNWPLEGLLFDVEKNALWLDSWGTRPDSEAARKHVLTALVKKAPPLIPFFGHCYLIETPIKTGNPILSVYQSDIIFCGTNLRNFLIAGAYPLFGMHNKNFRYEGIDNELTTAIPFWGELILLNNLHVPRVGNWRGLDNILYNLECYFRRFPSWRNF